MRHPSTRHSIKDALTKIQELADANKDHGDDFGDDEAKGAAIAYRDAHRLLMNSSPTAEIEDIADDLQAKADEALLDYEENGNLLLKERFESLAEAAAMVREHLADLEDTTEPSSHPLDTAIAVTTDGASSYASVPRTTEGLYIAIACCASYTYSTTRSTDATYRQAQLAHTAYRASQLLRLLGVGDPWQAMRDEYDRARIKHGDMTLDNPTTPDTLKYYALMEEVGEVARCLTYDREHAGDLTTEVTQVGALALAWLATTRQED